MSRTVWGKYTKYTGDIERCIEMGHVRVYGNLFVTLTYKFKCYPANN